MTISVQRNCPFDLYCCFQMRTEMEEKLKSEELQRQQEREEMERELENAKQVC